MLNNDSIKIVLNDFIAYTNYYKISRTPNLEIFTNYVNFNMSINQYFTSLDKSNLNTNYILDLNQILTYINDIIIGLVPYITTNKSIRDALVTQYKVHSILTETPNNFVLYEDKKYCRCKLLKDFVYFYVVGYIVVTGGSLKPSIMDRIKNILSFRGNSLYSSKTSNISTILPYNSYNDFRCILSIFYSVINITLNLDQNNLLNILKSSLNKKTYNCCSPDIFLNEKITQEKILETINNITETILETRSDLSNEQRLVIEEFRRSAKIIYSPEKLSKFFLKNGKISNKIDNYFNGLKLVISLSIKDGEISNNIANYRESLQLIMRGILISSALSIIIKSVVNKTLLPDSNTSFNDLYGGVYLLVKTLTTLKS
jgi:hypothetical protein